ncbi:MAG: DUF6089 family protein [Muribaculaceae bacterium]
MEYGVKRIFTILTLVAAFAMNLMAQDYRFEIGGALGTSGYLGDVNKGNFLRKPGVSAGAVFRYIPNYRWAIKGSLNVATISGDSRSEKLVFVGGSDYEFKSTLIDFGGQAEFNFFNFGIGSKYKNLKRLTPYLTLGLGATMASCSGSSAFAVNLPMGVGVKYKLKERLNMGAEFTMRKCFGDKIDGLSDLNGIKSSFAKNTDWYSLIQVSITYEFGKRCRVCHYVD